MVMPKPAPMKKLYTISSFALLWPLAAVDARIAMAMPRTASVQVDTLMLVHAKQLCLRLHASLPSLPERRTHVQLTGEQMARACTHCRPNRP